jgi:2-iminobutanoate/2-iminopropanoate deaminase
MAKWTVAPEQPLPISAAVVANGTVYVTGQVAFGPDGGLVGAGDAEAQSRQCFLNIERIISQAGCTLSDIVSLTAYLADHSVGPSYFAVRRELFPVDPPATTTIVATLSNPEYLVEVQAIAAVPS